VPVNRSSRRFALAAPLSLASTIGCAGAPRPPLEEPPRTYREALRRSEAAGAALAPGSAAERRALERLQHALSDFKAPDLRERLRDAYAEEVWFDDTLKTIEGRDALELYLAASADALLEGTVEFLGWSRDDRGNYLLRWEMRLRFAKLAGGEPKVSIGVSHLRFDAAGRAVLHQDFWDSAGGLWEHVPGLGALLRYAKRRL